jgi:hypothetical protein
MEGGNRSYEEGLLTDSLDPGEWMVNTREESLLCGFGGCGSVVIDIAILECDGCWFGIILENRFFF